MKYGVIFLNYGERTHNNVGYNIGDPIQELAVLELYKKMNIPDSDIQAVSLSELQSYDGPEYVLLPILGVAVGIQFGKMPFSPKIIPVFISTHIAKSDLETEEVEYLKRYSPIGCRDEYSLNTMRKYNIPAYLCGCITVLFEKRTVLPENERVIFVDIPDSVKKYIPDDLLKDAEFISHLLPLPQKDMTDEDVQDYLTKASELLEYYKEHASLVVSSRMHALVPCMAMGIPVIGVFENISYRFSWLDKYIKLYTKDEFDSVDWNPKPISYEEQKAALFNLFSEQITENYKKYSKLLAISEFYENRSKSEYGNYYSEKVRKIKNVLPDSFEYIIWGCGLAGSIVYDIMQNEFPNARLIYACDSFVKGTWKGVEIIHPDELVKYRRAFVLLASYSAKQAGYELFDKLNYVEEKDFIYLGTKNG